MCLTVVTPDEINIIINSLKNEGAGYDDLSVSILKMVSSSIINRLAHLYDLSFDQSVFFRWNLILQMWYHVTKQIIHTILIIIVENANFS